MTLPFIDLPVAAELRGCRLCADRFALTATTHAPRPVVWFAPGEKHWHGATATTAVTHIAVQEKLNGKALDWLEPVSDEQYGASPDAE